MSAPLTVQLILGELTPKVHTDEPVEKLAWILLELKLLNANVVAEGEAELSAAPG